MFFPQKQMNKECKTLKFKVFLKSSSKKTKLFFIISMLICIHLTFAIYEWVSEWVSEWVEWMNEWMFDGHVMAGMYQTWGAHMPSRTRCTRLVMPGLDAGGLQSPLLPANIFCALLLKPVTAFQWLQQLLWIKWSMTGQMFVMQQESSPSCIAIWWARAGVCTADPVSACCSTSFDLVQCRGKGGRKGDNRDPSLQFSLLKYATSLFTPFICMPYTAIWSYWGWVMRNRFFFLNNRCAKTTLTLTLTLHVATLAHANATERLSHMRSTFANFVNVQAKQIHGGKAS